MSPQTTVAPCSPSTSAASWWRPATTAIAIVGAAGFLLPLLFVVALPHSQRHFALKTTFEFVCLAMAPVLFLFGLQPEVGVLEQLDAAAVNGALYAITSLLVLLVRRHAPRLRPSLFMLLGLWLICVSLTLMPWYR